MRTFKIVVASLGFVSSGTVATAADLPFRIATSSEIASLTQPAVIATTLSQTNFTTAATITVQKPGTNASSKTQRGNQAHSGVYNVALAAGVDPNPHPVPPAVASTDFIDYEKNHDSVQAWASMSESGAPFVMVYADGKTNGQSAASWSTRYIVQGTGNRDVYAQFRVPAINFTDRWEDATPGLFWARMRINFLVNAYPAWSTESLRFNEFYFHTDPNNGVTTTIHKTYLDSFGQSLGLDDTHPSATSRTVTIMLGTYPAGKALDFTSLFQAEAKLDALCGDDADEIVCNGASVKVNWEPNAAQPTFYSKPASGF